MPCVTDVGSAIVYKWVPYSQRYLVLGLVGLGLLLTVTIRISRVSAMVSVRFSRIWDRRLQVCLNKYHCE